MSVRFVAGFFRTRAVLSRVSVRSRFRLSTFWTRTLHSRFRLSTRRLALKVRWSMPRKSNAMLKASPKFRVTLYGRNYTKKHL